MRKFWILIGVLTLGSAAYLCASTPKKETERAVAPVQIAVPAPAPIAVPPDNTPASRPVEAPAPQLSARASPERSKLAATEPKPPVDVPAASEPAMDLDALLGTPKGEIAPARTPSPIAGTPEGPVAEAPPPGSTGTTHGTATVPRPPETKPADAGAAAPAYDVAEGTVEQRDDGSLVVDGKLTIKGEGTSAKPYEISWDVLTGVEQTYDPKNAKKKIPRAVAMLDGKVVRVSGYVAFPLAVDQPRELLAMLNQWDGCCIGVPPTPYDAIEVRLKKIVTGDARYAISGSVQGLFRVKPYLVGDWLVGLYVMDGASFTAMEYGGFGK